MRTLAAAGVLTALSLLTAGCGDEGEPDAGSGMSTDDFCTQMRVIEPAIDGDGPEWAQAQDAAGEITAAGVPEDFPAGSTDAFIEVLEKVVASPDAAAYRAEIAAVEGLDESMADVDDYLWEHCADED